MTGLGIYVGVVLDGFLLNVVIVCVNDRNFVLYKPDLIYTEFVLGFQGLFDNFDCADLS